MTLDDTLKKLADDVDAEVSVLAERALASLDPADRDAARLVLAAAIAGRLFGRSALAAMPLQPMAYVGLHGGGLCQHVIDRATLFIGTEQAADATATPGRRPPGARVQ